jgi:hypothetical protein
MVGIDNTLILLEFKGIGSEDPEQPLFVCQTIWTTKNVHNDGAKIAQLESNFRGSDLVWYMKLQSTTHIGQTRKLSEITKVLLKEFKKPKSKP